MITILSNDCPKCLLAKQAFAHQNPEIYKDWLEIPNHERRRNMLASVADADGDVNNRPLIFKDDEFIDWQPTLQETL